MGSGSSLGRTLCIAIFAFAVLAFGAWVAVQQRVDEPLQFAIAAGEIQNVPSAVDDEPLDAMIMDDEPDSASS